MVRSTLFAGYLFPDVLGFGVYSSHYEALISVIFCLKLLLIYEINPIF